METAVPSSKQKTFIPQRKQGHSMHAGSFHGTANMLEIPTHSCLTLLACVVITQAKVNKYTHELGKKISSHKHHLV